MRNNNSDYNSEAVKIANALKPMFKTWFDEWARSCVRVKKMTVSTAPSNGIVGVKDAFSDKEIFAKYTPSVANAKVGDTVWCRWYFDNMQTLYASDMGNVSSADASFDNATINNDLSVYGDFFIGSTTLTEASLQKLLTPQTLTVTNSHTTARFTSIGGVNVVTLNDLKDLPTGTVTVVVSPSEMGDFLPTTSYTQDCVAMNSALERVRLYIDATNGIRAYNYSSNTGTINACETISYI